MGSAGKAACFLILLLTAQEAPAQPTAARVVIDPQEIAVDLLYSGAQIRVSGETQAGEDLVVVCAGEESTVELKQKGKIWGLLWVNTGDIAFKRVPVLYQVASSKRIRDLATAADLARIGVGFAALEADIAPEGDEQTHRGFSELIKLKEREGLYSIQEGILEIHPQGSGMQHFSTTLRFPSSVEPGRYRLRLISFAAGRTKILANAVVSVRLAGAAAVIRSLSMKHGLAYGIISVIIALVAGLLTGSVFGRRSRKGGH